MPTGSRVNAHSIDKTWHLNKTNYNRTQETRSVVC